MHTGGTYLHTHGDADQFLKDMDAAMTSAGWTSSKIFAQVTFEVLSIPQGAIFTAQSSQFIIWDPNNIVPPPPGYIVINLGATDIITLTNLSGPFASALGGSVGFIGISEGFPIMQIINIPNNNENVSVFPTGSVGEFVASGAAPGLGITYGGGFTWTSAVGPSATTPVIISGTKDTTPGVVFKEIVSGQLYPAFSYFNASGIQILASKYQVFLTNVNNYISGSFFVAAHMVPVGGETNFNFVNGPIVVGGGFRNQGFSSISNGSPIINGIGVSATDVTFQLPAFVGSLSALNLIYDSNSIRGNNQGLMWDAFLAYRPANFGGMFWDTFLVSVAASIDSVGSYGDYTSDQFTTMLSCAQAGQMTGAMMTLRQSSSLTDISGQIDSSVIGSAGTFDLKGPSSFLSVLNTITGGGPPAGTSVREDYAF